MTVPNVLHFRVRVRLGQGVRIRPPGRFVQEIVISTRSDTIRMAST
jgi:hypothetical protein